MSSENEMTLANIRSPLEQGDGVVLAKAGPPLQRAQAKIPNTVDRAIFNVGASQSNEMVVVDTGPTRQQGHLRIPKIPNTVDRATFNVGASQSNEIALVNTGPLQQGHLRIPNMVDKLTFTARVSRKIAIGAYPRMKTYTTPGHQAHIELVTIYHKALSNNGGDKRKALKVVTETYNRLSQTVRDGMPTLKSIKCLIDVCHIDGKKLMKRKDDGTSCRTLFDLNEIYDIAYAMLRGDKSRSSGEPLCSFNIQNLVSRMKQEYELNPCGKILFELQADNDETVTPKKSKNVGQQQFAQYQENIGQHQLVQYQGTASSFASQPQNIYQYQLMQCHGFAPLPQHFGQQLMRFPPAIVSFFSSFW